MTCIVSYIENDVVYMAADSAAHSAGEKFVMRDHKLFYKYWHKKPIMLVGAAGSIRCAQIFNHLIHLNDPAQFNSDEHFIHVTLQQFTLVLSNAKYSEKEHEEYEFVIGYNGKVYVCSYGQYVLDANNYSTAGSGGLHAAGVLHYLSSAKSNMVPNKKLMAALNAACAHATGCSPPYTFLQLPMKVED